MWENVTFGATITTLMPTWWTLRYSLCLYFAKFCHGCTLPSLVSLLTTLFFNHLLWARTFRQLGRNCVSRSWKFSRVSIPKDHLGLLLTRDQSEYVAGLRDRMNVPSICLYSNITFTEFSTAVCILHPLISHANRLAYRRLKTNYISRLWGWVAANWYTLSDTKFNGT